MTARSEAHTVYIGVGSNIERERNVTECLTALVEAFTEVAVSSLYESRAVGHEGAPYYNLVARFQTELTLPEVDRLLHAIEAAQGRKRGEERFADRTLDVDILLYDDLTGVHDEIRLPREEIWSAAHVLLPLSEIAGELSMPGDGRTTAELWRDFDLADQRIERVRFQWRGIGLPALLKQ